MKEKVKIWSRRRLLGAFLAFLGLAAVANAQNGTVNANCGGQLIAITRTADQMNSSEGITFPLTFTGVEAGDEYYFVAAQGGSFSSIATGTGCGLTPNQLGANLNVVSPRPDGTSPAPSMAGSFIDITQPINVNVKPINPVSGGEVYYLGVFVKDLTTSCYSDVYWVRINVEDNIYAYLNLTTNNDSNQYICNEGTTIDLGITLCSLPKAGKLNYTVETFNMVNGVTIDGYNSGLRIAATGNNDGEVTMSAGTPQVAAINVTLDDDTDYKSISIGTQTLHNPSPEKAGELEFRFTNMTYIYTDAAGDQVELPVKFITGNECDAAMGMGRTGIYDSIFNVHVAPSFKVQALAYKEGERPASVTGGYMNGTGFVTGGAEAPTFCQGLDAYLHTEYSTTEGFITSYTWSQLAPTDDDQQLTITNNTDRAPVTSDLTQLAYQLKVATLWNDATSSGNYGAGCSANDTITITITEAPKLLVQATNSTFTHDGDVCPGTPINISAQDGSLADGHAITAENILSTGNGIIIDHNNANFSYTIETSGTDLKVFDTWRATQVTEGNLPVVNDFFDNEDNVDPAGNGTITYTIQTITTGEGVGTNVCPLVNFDGTALTETTTVDGNTTTTVTNAVKAVYTVSPRPQFQLGAN